MKEQKERFEGINELVYTLKIHTTARKRTDMHIMEERRIGMHIMEERRTGMF